MGCQPEVDSIWNITWPPTEVGKVATRKCPGGNEVTGMHILIQKLYVIRVKIYSKNLYLEIYIITKTCTLILCSDNFTVYKLTCVKSVEPVYTNLNFN